MIDAFHRKAADTLSAIMRDLNLSSSAAKLLSSYSLPTLENTQAILKECVSMLEARSRIYRVLKELQTHESLVADVKHTVDLNLAESVDQQTLAKILALASRLAPLTQSLRANICHLRDEYRLFGRIAALSSKSKTVVNNVFIYKKRDALKWCLQEYEDVRRLLTVFDIKELP